MDVSTIGLLKAFPILLCVWSVLVVLWGTVASTLMYKLMKKSPNRHKSVLRQSDKYTLFLVGFVNIFLSWYVLSFDPSGECASWVVVINVFYTAHLICMSIDITRWWNSLSSMVTSRA